MLAIIASRMSSRRLPGKALIDVDGQPLLSRVIDRVRQAKQVTEILVATSAEDSDDLIAELCTVESVLCFRGSLRDTAGRLAAATQREGAEEFVRISGDSPLIDPVIIDDGVDLFVKSSVDLMTNIFPRTFPAGQSVEVISTDALVGFCAKDSNPSYREHVTAGFYAQPSSWRIRNFRSGQPGPHPSFAVDTLDDLRRIESLIRRVGDGPSDWRALCALEAVQ